MQIQKKDITPTLKAPKKPKPFKVVVNDNGARRIIELNAVDLTAQDN